MDGVRADGAEGALWGILPGRVDRCIEGYERGDERIARSRLSDGPFGWNHALHAQMISTDLVLRGVLKLVSREPWLPFQSTCRSRLAMVRRMRRPRRRFL